MGMLLGLAGFGIALLSGNLYVIVFCGATLAVNIAFAVSQR